MAPKFTQHNLNIHSCIYTHTHIHSFICDIHSHTHIHTYIIHSFGTLISLIFFTLAFIQHELSININRLPLLLGLVHMSLMYPAVSLLLWPMKFTVWRLTGYVPSTTAGDWPLKSATLREFWGWRYNQVIGQICRNAVFKPLVSYVCLVCGVVCVSVTWFLIC